MKIKIEKMANGEIETESLKVKPYPTIFKELFDRDLPLEKKSVKRLGEEAQTILGAGLETTTWA
jgi:hypothetical protein